MGGRGEEAISTSGGAHGGGVGRGAGGRILSTEGVIGMAGGINWNRSPVVPPLQQGKAGEREEMEPAALQGRGGAI